MKKKKSSSIKTNSETTFDCANGGCIWVQTAEGWEEFSSCEGSCHCPDGPPMLRSLREAGEVIISICVGDGKNVGTTILSEGNLVFVPGMIFDPNEFDNYCIAVSIAPGKWRYGHRGKNASRPKDRGHLDSLPLEKGVVRLDRLSMDGTKSLELCGIGWIEPTFGYSKNAIEELKQFQKRRRHR